VGFGGGGGVGSGGGVNLVFGSGIFSGDERGTVVSAGTRIEIRFFSRLDPLGLLRERAKDSPDREHANNRRTKFRKDKTMRKTPVIRNNEFSGRKGNNSFLCH
jgi:hypothetical protein